ncbi:putative WD40/YVTN repeat-like-containing domain superfamily, WD40-repeat-containing [Plasmopara halstedii]
MKVKTISRVEKEFTQEVQSDKLKVFRNYDPALHPFERPREYIRALNAVKLERMFAKPFVGALDGHCDGVTALATNPKSLVAFVSGAADGEVRVWDLPRRKCVWNVYGHRGFVRGLAVAVDGNSFYSCSEDKTVKQWALRIKEEDEGVPTPLTTFTSKEPFFLYFIDRGIDHHWSENIFATCGSKVQVWDPSRSTPTHEFAWGADSITSVHFNPAEASLLASTGSDRNITLYDSVWHRQCANEDHNLYTFDMRQMTRAMKVHKDHVSAVMDVAYSPTGREFVAGSYDRTIRIFNVRSAKSREVYHTQRMQRYVWHFHYVFLVSTLVLRHATCNFLPLESFRSSSVPTRTLCYPVVTIQIFVFGKLTHRKNLQRLHHKNVVKWNITSRSKSDISMCANLIEFQST